MKFGAAAFVVAAGSSRNSGPRPCLVATHLAALPVVFHHGSEIQTIDGVLGRSALSAGIREFLVPSAFAADNAAPKPPTNAEVKLLQDALGAVYGERNPEKGVELLSQAITAWERQNPDEKAALYRVRGDSYLSLVRLEEASKDYTTTIELLNKPGALELADPGELPAAYLGRARSMRAQSLTGNGVLSQGQWSEVSKDYQMALRLSSREDWDTEAEREEDGAQRNPYAAWEWGMTKRNAGDSIGASETHSLAAFAFKDIGDKPRSAIAALDAGIDLAGTDKVKETKELLENAIKSTVAVEGSDVELLQRVIAKEGEARIALASVLWGANDKSGAEAELGEACVRLDQLDADAEAREAARLRGGKLLQNINKATFSIDDIAGAGRVSCSRFKNEKFLTEKLEWPESLQKKVQKLNKLG